MQDSGNTSPPSAEDTKPAVRENLPMAGLDSGVGNSFSSRENTPRDNKDAQNGGGDRKAEDNKEENKNDNDDDDVDDEEESQSQSESGSESGEEEEDTESEGEVVKGKTPFVL